MIGSSHNIAADLQKKIETGFFLPKLRLDSERELAEQYQVSRGTIRRALQSLHIKKLVKIIPNSGVFITYESQPIEELPEVIKSVNPVELLDTRLAMEPHICRLASINGTHDDFVKLKEILAKVEQNHEDIELFSQYDAELHGMIAQMAQNRLISWFIAQTNLVRNQKQWQKLRYQSLNKNTIAIYNQQHREIVTAITEREPEKAANLMRNHLNAARSTLVYSG